MSLVTQVKFYIVFIDLIVFCKVSFVRHFCASLSISRILAFLFYYFFCIYDTSICINDKIVRKL